MNYSLEEKVKQSAIISRLGVVILQFVANFLIPDHEAGVFQKPLEQNSLTYLDSIIQTSLSGLTRWDAQYFLHIAQYGYTYENTLAFFPLFPLIIRQLAYFIVYVTNSLSSLLLLENLLSIHSALILVAVLFNNFIFVKTSTVLYRLSLLVLRNEKLAYVSAILFCYNPASIFFSAAYSESLYCFLIFYGLLKIEEKNSLVNYVIIGMTGAVRSNGLINLGFVIYKYIKLKCTVNLPFFYNIIFNFGLILSILPFLGYQLYCYAKFCWPNEVVLPKIIYNHGNENNFIFPGSNSSWCKYPIPFAYAYVQKHYWNVGFLKYYEIKQMPNFLLALPMIFIIARGTLSYVKHYKHLILFLGFVNGDAGGNLPLSTFPYVVHGFALTVFAVLMIHIQVATRLLASSSPLPYWYCARVIAASLKNSVETEVLHKLGKKEKECYYESYVNKKSKWKTFLFSESFSGYPFFIKWYFLIYYFVGTLMFSNFLPWT